jgi:transcriptional regulator with XRE-family HTH domain
LKYLKNNLRFLRENKGLNQVEMSHQLGFSRSTWNNYERGKSNPTLEDLERIAKYFGVKISSILEIDLSTTGNLNLKERDIKNLNLGNLNSNLKGNLNLKNEEKSLVFEPPAIYSKMPQVITVDTYGEENVVMVPVRARDGYLNGYSDPEFISTLPSYKLPGLHNGTFRIFEVEGPSMIPSLYDKDLIICSFVDNLQDIRNDRVHVIVTKNDGIVVKVVLNRLLKENKLILKSENHKEKDNFPPIIIDPSDIIEAWYGFAFISRNFRRSTEQYNRLIDLESRLTLIEDSLKKPKK